MMKLQQNPLFAELSSCQNILLAGAGGGFDIYSAIPLFFSLRGLNKNIHLANLSFASLRDQDSQISDHCFKVTSDTAGSDSYFPERTLSRWLNECQGISQPVYAFPQCGVVPLHHSYELLIKELELDAIVLVDGGTDSLMRGDEVGLGTPSEDVTSMVAVNRTDVQTKILSCIGFGVDRFHGVCHAQFLESVAALAEAGAYLGAFSVLAQMTEAERYLELVEYSNMATTSRPSIVNTSIASAISGKFGDHHATFRTQGSKLWISPLMSMYWSFQLPAVVERNLYADLLLETQELHEVVEIIQQFRNGRTIRAWDSIPD